MNKMHAACVPPLDAEFQPAINVLEAHRCAARQAGSTATATIAVLQGNETVARFSVPLLPAGHPAARNNFRLLERCAKFLLWAYGGHRLLVAAPAELVDALRKHYEETPTGRFDADVMGRRVYDAPFTVERVEEQEIPPVRPKMRSLGGHLEGCRIGFDLGASDRKVAAVRDGEVMFSAETPWTPSTQPDPAWHFAEINRMLHEAAKHLPRVDAIGGSSAGIIVDNRIKIASLFRAVPEDVFRTKGQYVFLDLQKAWGGVPFEVANDGDVTALAGAMSLKDTAVLGIAMGSSQAAGYVDPQGAVTGWLNELAFAPVDLRDDAPRDEWSGDVGCGVQYFSQQAVGRLLRPAGIEAPADMPLPEKLVMVQQLMAAGDERAARIYETMGVYLGMTLAWYAEFYEVRHVLLLGRVMTGAGGQIIIDTAGTVLKAAFPALAERIALHTPDERMKRHGQAIAAASLPPLR